tara:strand:- start:324 stop:788 length:465 start_codon:yes stop_codon:yes gene_type:complete
MRYYIYEVPGEKIGATADLKRRNKFNINKYQIEPIIIETLEGPDTEDMWQVVGDREWELADHYGYNRGKHYKVIRLQGLKGAAKAGGWNDNTRHRFTTEELKYWKGKTMSEESNNKRSIALLGRPKPKTECPHCNRMIANNMLDRYHNDNCKLA